MLWIYSANDTYFGPDTANRMHEAFTTGGKAEFQMLPPFGSDGHFLIDAADAIPLWSPLLALQLPFCFEVSALSGGLVSSSPA